jgi:nitroimidazol reductase NimA-like FMN-containing flavoprotein (pyridoxamine 5'-phosphate oxidase superfamily)
MGHMDNATAQTGSDLGRRIVEQRHRAGLSVEEAADRAGMPVSYLRYLETSATPNPGSGVLGWLAAALGTTPGALRGAGHGQPPGQGRAAARPVLESLTADECRAYLAAGGIGRFLYLAPRGPVAVPVNYRMLGDDIVFRTASASSVADGVRQPRVSFDVDHIDDALSEGWSVLASGTASLITDPDVLEQVAALAIEPWAGGQRDACVRIVAREISGRRIRALA